MNREEGEPMVNSIANASMQMKQAQLAQSVSTSVLKMGMNQSKSQASDLLQMIDDNRRAMEQSVNPHIGGNFDTRV